MNLLQAHLSNYNVPVNLNGNWNFGFILGICLILQLITGLALSVNYLSEVPWCFYSVVFFMEEAHNGTLFRYAHGNGACIFFLFMYVHMVKGILYSCTYLPLSWYTGILILVLSYAIAFFGYVLPLGEMSYWGATVIINLFYWCPPLREMLLGGYEVEGPTINRFYLFHFTLPFLLLFIVIIHIYYLHLSSSSNPLSNIDNYYGVRFYPVALSADIQMLWTVLAIHTLQYAYSPVALLSGDCENSMLANPYSTPVHIVPEWYLLPFYGTLKLLPTRISGLVAMLMFLQVLVQFVDYRAGMYTLPVQNVHRDFSNKRVLLIPSIITIGFIGSFTINPLTYSVGVFTLILYITLGVRSTQSSTPRTKSY